MKKIFASITAGLVLLGTPATAAPADGPSSLSDDMRVLPRQLTDAYCAYHGHDRSGQFCGSDLDRARVRHLFDQAVAAALAGDVGRSLMFYAVPKAELAAVAPDIDTDFFDLRLAMAATHGLCAARLRETGVACTPEQTTTLRQRLRRAYAAGRLDAAPLVLSTFASSQRTLYR